MIRLHFLESEDGDWIGVYLDGRLLEQGHSISARQLADALSDEIGIIVTSEARDVAFFAKHGYRCPEELYDENETDE